MDSIIDNPNVGEPDFKPTVRKTVSFDTSNYKYSDHLPRKRRQSGSKYSYESSHSSYESECRILPTEYDLHYDPTREIPKVIKTIDDLKIKCGFVGVKYGKFKFIDGRFLANNTHIIFFPNSGMPVEINSANLDLVRMD